MTITELKARAYDIFAQIQFLQNELAKVNQEIQQKGKELDLSGELNEGANGIDEHLKT